MESCRSSVSKIISCSVRKSGSQSACLQCGASSIRKAFTRYPVDNNLLRAEPFPQSSVYGGGNGVFLSLSSGRQRQYRRQTLDALPALLKTKGNACELPPHSTISIARGPGRLPSQPPDTSPRLQLDHHFLVRCVGLHSLVTRSLDLIRQVSQYEHNIRR